MSIENRIGPPVEGNNFYGRKKELEIANRLLNSGHSLLLSAPRRIGKSSLAKRLIEDKKAQNIPYFIQILFSKLRDNYTGSVTKEDVDIAYRQLCSESYLNTWSERLVEYREMERPARLILNGLSARNGGLKRETLFGILMTGQDPSKAEDIDLVLSKVLEMLENDGYLLRKESVRSFRSPLLRDYWYGKFVQ